VRILLAVHRYHQHIVGGSEAAARVLAESLANDGHQVDVVTSCSTDHRTWSNDLPPGVTGENGVSIHRLQTIRNRTENNFYRINERVNVGLSSMVWEQQLWARRLGPDLSGYGEWLDGMSSNFDVAVVMTYLYPTATVGLPLLSSRLPTVLFPTAHFEAAFRHLHSKSVIRQAHALAFLTPEERDLVYSLTKSDIPSAVVGLPVEGHVKAFTNTKRLHERLESQRYFVCVGRIDVGKGTFDLIEMFKSFKHRFPSDIKLVLVGEADTNDGDIISLGFCTEEEKREAISGAIALIHPSFLESFSIVLCEAWLQERPVVVNGLCDVTSGQVSRSGGGLSYKSHDEFCAILHSLVTQPQIAKTLGKAGHSYVRANYTWEVVSGHLYPLIAQAKKRFASSGGLD